MYLGPDLGSEVVLLLSCTEKFDQKALLIVGIFETSCIHRSFHNEHENVICTKKSFIEKNISNLWAKK